MSEWNVANDLKNTQRKFDNCSFFTFGYRLVWVIYCFFGGCGTTKGVRGPILSSATIHHLVVLTTKFHRFLPRSFGVPSWTKFGTNPQTDRQKDNPVGDVAARDKINRRNNITTGYMPISFSRNLPWVWGTANYNYIVYTENTFQPFTQK